MYAILKDKHKTIARPTTFDIFSVTYDPAMIKEAVQVMMDRLNGKGNIEQSHVIPVKVVDSNNVADFKPFGTYEEK